MKYPFRNTKLPLAARINDLLARLTIDEKINMLSTYQHGVKRLGIDDWHIGAEVARGYVSRNKDEVTTVFPEPIGMAGMFDPPLMEKLGEIAGVEARILNHRHPDGHLMLWGPTVDACRDPRWGRNEEGYGEDPFLTGQMSIAYTKGMAGDDERYMRTIPSLKHFCCDNNEQDRGSCSANIEPRTKHEYYYEFFRPSIEEGGTYSMMAAYNELSGVPAVINPELQSIIKDEWGLGFVVTDGGDFSQNVLSHRYSDTHAETIALALKAGTDIMTDDGELVAASAREALARGLMTEDDIDRSLFNSLGARFKLGEFDPPEQNPYIVADESIMDCDEHKKANHTAALEQIVLLKNNTLLPLKKNTKIAVIGDLGDKNYMDWYTGFSSYNTSILDGLIKKFGKKNVSFDDGHDHVAIRSKATGKLLTLQEDGSLCALDDKPTASSTFAKADWDGEVTYRCKANEKFFTAETMKADSETTFRWFSQEILRPHDYNGFVKYETYFKNKLLSVDADGKVITAEKNRTTDEKLFTEILVSDGAKRAAKLAENADVVIVCVGNNPMIVARECYDRTTLALPPHQSALVDAVCAVNKNTLLTVVSGYPFSICKEQEEAAAVIYTSHAGPELGNAFAEVISGEYNPAGRLAQTWYTHEDELPSIMDYDIIKNGSTYLYYEGKPLYPFGYGISYSSFEYANLTLSHKDKETLVSFDIKNTSAVDGEEVAQIYFKPENPRVKRALKQLCGFRRVKIKAGETVRIEIPVEDRYLRFYDVTREKFCVESGTYEFMCGASCEDIKLRGKLDIKGETIPPRDLTLPTQAINYDDKGGTKMLYAKNESRHYMSGGMLLFNGVKFSGEKSLQIYYATTLRHGNIKVFCGNELICEEKLPVTVSPTGFTYKTLAIKPKKGVHDMRIQLDCTSLMELKLI